MEDLFISYELVLSDENRAPTYALLQTLQERRLLYDEFVHGDGDGGMTTRWPEARLFADVMDGQIYVSQLSSWPHGRISRMVFERSETGPACDCIEAVLHGASLCES